MTEPRPFNDQWELSGGLVLSTRELYTRFATEEIRGETPCRRAGQNWSTVGAQFTLLWSSDRQRTYGLLKPLGAGAFGTVHLALEIRPGARENTGRLVALKQPTPALLSHFVKQIAKDQPRLSMTEREGQAKQRIGQFFSKEATLTARLAMCPHVAKIIDHDVNRPYMALEYCSEGSLSGRMKDNYSSTDIVRWALEIALALEAAHSLEPDQLIHRDLKPDTILIEKGQLKISDFGTAQMVHMETLSSLKGGYTPLYAAPEAFDGRAYPATDLWSLGVILYELISKTLPFPGGSSYAALANAILSKEPPELRAFGEMTLVPELRSFVSSCLEKDPRGRPSASQAVALLKTLQLSGAMTELVSQDAESDGQEGQTQEDEGRSEGSVSSSKTLVFSIVSLLALALLIATFVILDVSKWNKLHETGDRGKSSLNQGEGTTPFQLSDLDILQDRGAWNKASEAKQDWVIKEMRKRLRPDYRWLKTERYECQGLSHRIASFRHVGTGLVLHLIPGGTFRMGTVSERWKGFYKERPLRSVTVEAFLVGRYEVRQEIWDELGGVDTRRFRGAQRPIDSVTWRDARKWLKTAGGGLRLPSEAEWEYACRAGSTTSFFWGETMDSSYSWTKLNCADVGLQGSREIHLHFQSRKWNAFGLVDMSGNVWEWVEDAWRPNYEGAPKTGLPVSGETVLRPLRGGCWINDTKSARSGRRNEFEGNKAYFVNGFRVARSLPGAQ